MSKRTGGEEYIGVMDASYATARQRANHLIYRLQVRAQLAVDTYREFGVSDPEPRVLELGAAEGLTLQRMRELLGTGGEYLGVEYATDLIEMAGVLPDNVRLVQGDVMALPDDIEEGGWNLVTALAVLEHLSDPGAAIREAYRMLAPGGVFVATCPNPFWDDLAGRFNLVEDEFHEVEVDEDLMLSLAADAGFTHFEYRPFMWVITGVLPYLGFSFEPRVSLEIDDIVRRFPGLGVTFVNQALIAVKED